MGNSDTTAGESESVRPLPQETQTHIPEPGDIYVGRLALKLRRKGIYNLRVRERQVVYSKDMVVLEVLDCEGSYLYSQTVTLDFLRTYKVWIGRKLLD